MAVVVQLHSFNDVVSQIGHSGLIFIYSILITLTQYTNLYHTHIVVVNLTQKSITTNKVLFSTFTST